MRLVHADAIVVGDGPTILDGAVLYGDDGVIANVGRAVDVLPASSGVQSMRVHGVLLPGLVNAHTHVELSALHGKVRGGSGFLRWVDEMLGVRFELDESDTHVSIATQVKALSSYGTAAVGEVTNTLHAVEALAELGIGGCIFHEVFGADRDASVGRADALAEEVERRFARWPSSDLSYAPTPHTLYTTHPDAVRRLLDVARSLKTRASLHLLEHASERKAIEEASGDVVAWLGRRAGPAGAAFAWPKTPVLDYAASLGALSPEVLLVHLTDATDRELDRIAAAGSPVVSCPRSNLTIEGRIPPVPSMLRAGIEPALGTDSLASSPSLDVLGEAAALRTAFPDLSAETLLRMATWNGARALGRTDLGRVAKGAAPGLFALEIALPSGRDPNLHVLDNLGAPRSWMARRLPASRTSRPTPGTTP